ncbi:putative bifunctional diguanylate cyclase/phosphodiesterase [Miltoncostaea marina]|uniref:putative bifunctional diguanylate cyclase/phosphodiesterase n=1 Tax=Miltoncostaea marina TaxID=2843215 RepID=UPI001C3E3472|nr:EAL domain-containing protein [Miltoncostaea marina]
MQLLPARIPRPAAVAAAVVWPLVLAALAAYGLHLWLGVRPGPVGAATMDRWVYTGLVVVGAVGIVARALLVRAERGAWLLIGAGALLWAAGDVWWVVELSGLEQVPYPSVADGLYLAFYPLVYAGFVLMVRARVRRFHASQWLDGVAAALVVGAVGAGVLMPPILEGAEGASRAAVLTNLAYPLGDTLVLAIVTGLAALFGWRPGRDVALLAAGALTFAGADAVYLFQVTEGTYVEGGGLDFFWPLGMVCMAAAAWQPAPRATPARLEGWSLMVLPGGVVITAIGALVLDHYARSPGYVVWMAAAALLVCVLRAGLTFRENISQSVTDSLTGLPNRRLFHDRVEQAIAQARRHGRRAAVMLIDLDRFKEVNDTLGHRAGDVVLDETARRLRGALRDSDTIARLGGDEFAVLLPDVPDVGAAERVAAVLSEAIAHPVVVDGLQLDTEASIGITLYPDHGADVATLQRRADVAMYTAKAESLPYATYGDEQDEYSPERLALVGELRRAIERDELVVHYQPKVDLLTGGLVGAEALVRWQHPVRGLLAPGEFIPVAEHTALIRPLTRYVLDRALADCRRWEAAGRALPVAVNISARNLLDTGFADLVADSLERSGVPAGRLELELTETALMENPARALDVLLRLGGLGVVLSIDDFGVGYTSLNQLKRLPISVLKIDRSFVNNMDAHPADELIVRSTVDLGHNLGLQVVAEGIESQEVQDALRGIGCDVGQGFHTGRPVPADEFARLLVASGASGPALAAPAV